MKIKFRYISLMIIWAFVLFYSPIKIHADTGVIIHYQRGDNDYSKWKIWGWADGKDGADFDFTGKDSFGGIANINIPSSTTKVGFIVKTSDWKKDVEEDRFIDLAKGNEIWVSQGKKDFAYEAPKGYKQNVQTKNFKMNVDYNVYDNNLQNLQFICWKKNQTINDATKVHLVNGKCLLDMKTADNIKFSIERNGKVVDYTDGIAFINKADSDGNLNLNLSEGTGIVDYSKDYTVDKSIKSATIEGINRIDVKLSYPVKLDGKNDGFTVLDDKGNKIEIKNVKVNDDKTVYKNLEKGYGVSFEIYSKNNLDFASDYTVKNAEYKECKTTLGNVFDTTEFIKLYTYTGNDLGSTYSKEKTNFRVWAPTAKGINLLFYKSGQLTDKNIPTEKIPMVKDKNGTWIVSVKGDNKNRFYNYEVNVSGKTNVAVDPYAKAVGVNGEIGMVVDLDSTNPKGFVDQNRPPFKNPTDAIIYELQVRDLSMNKDSGIKNKGKYLGLIQTGTKNSMGESTGIDHIKELGITHVHLLPIFDFKTIDETKLDVPQYNWGYDPQNYNVPEGSYSTNPYDGNVRINELKQVVQGFHSNGIRVVEDVVFNHTYSGSDSNLNKIVPGYYYRFDSNGNFSNGSGCGNETASERSMMRKFMVDSVKYWATEYKIDGFRFDVMALHDINTMNTIRDALNKIDPSIIMYGEGWKAGDTPLPVLEQATKQNAKLVNKNIAFFDDDMRDAIKGGVFDAKSAGFVNGSKSKDNDLKFGIVAATKHDGINLEGVDYSKDFWAKEPTQTINYTSVHDNMTLWDKLLAVSPKATDKQLTEMNKLSAAIILTSQGIPFFQGGEEIARTKQGDNNSYKSSDAINSIDWDREDKYMNLYNYYKGLILLRKSNKAFALNSADKIRSDLKFINTDSQVVAYKLKGQEKDQYGNFTVAFNGSDTKTTIDVKKDKYYVLVDGNNAGIRSLKTMYGDKLTIPAKSALVVGSEPRNSNNIFILMIAIVLGITGFAFIKYKPKSK